MSGFVDFLNQELHLLRERLTERALELQEANSSLQRKLQATEQRLGLSRVPRLSKDGRVASKEEDPSAGAQANLAKERPKSPRPHRETAEPPAKHVPPPPLHEVSPAAPAHESLVPLLVNEAALRDQSCLIEIDKQRSISNEAMSSPADSLPPSLVQRDSNSAPTPQGIAPAVSVSRCSDNMNNTAVMAHDAPPPFNSLVAGYTSEGKCRESVTDHEPLRPAEEAGELKLSRHNSKVSFLEEEISSEHHVSERSSASSDHHVNAALDAARMSQATDASGLLPGIFPRSLSDPSHSLPLACRYSSPSPREAGRSPSERRSKTLLRPGSADGGRGPSLTSKSSKNCKVFSLLPRWSEAAHLGVGSVALHASPSMQRKQNTQNFDDSDSEEGPSLRKGLTQRLTCIKNQTLHPTIKLLIMSPNSGSRFSWDVLGFVFIAYDAAVIPLQFFNIPKNTFFQTCNWITRLFWTLDIPLSFCTGFLTKSGAVEVRFRKIAKKYILSWFLLDFGIVLIDWLEWAMADGGKHQSEMGSVRVVKVFKFLRAVRMLRLLKLMKVPQVVSFMTEEFLTRLRSEKLFLLGGIAKVLGAFLVFVHFIACFWYFVGSSRDEPSAGWVHQHHLQDSDWQYKYMTSFHWSLAQFAGSVEILAWDLRERTYNVIVLLMAWIISAIATSIITTAMTRDSFLHIHTSMENVKLRRFMLDNGISKKLAARLLKNITFVSQKKARIISEEDLELLQLVSEPLRMELHYELHSKVLMEHPFFVQYVQVHASAMRRLCHYAIDLQAFSRGDIIFSQGDPMTDENAGLLFIREGVVKYYHDTAGKSVLSSGCWLCEGSMFTAWTHYGHLRGKAEISITRLKSEGFFNVASTNYYEQEYNFAISYAEQFLDSLNKTMHEELTDLGQPSSQLEAMVNKVFKVSAPDRTTTQTRRSSFEGFFRGRLSMISFGMNKLKSQLSKDRLSALTDHSDFDHS